MNDLPVWGVIHDLSVITCKTDLEEQICPYMIALVVSWSRSSTSPTKQQDLSICRTPYHLKQLKKSDVSCEGIIPKTPP
jgi:hypothetical protein